MAEYVFTMLRVSKFYGPERKVLDEITLAFLPGAKIGVLGPNGAGKSTLLWIMAAHRIPYVATLAIGSAPMLRDFRAKVARAAEVRGFRFLHVLGACPPGWRYATAQSTEIVRLAVESGYFPLFEVDDGSWRITFWPKKTVPVREFLETQGRFAHLSPVQVRSIQAHVDERWSLLTALESREGVPPEEQRGPSGAD